LTQLEKNIHSLEELLSKKEEELEVTDLDFNTCENVREDILNLDRLHVEVVVLKSRIKELVDMVVSKFPLFIILFTDFLFLLLLSAPKTTDLEIMIQ